MSVKIERDKVYLVTGGTGFLGKNLLSRLYDKGARIRVVARNEGNLVELKQQFPDVDFITGDMSQRSICAQVVKGVDGVFHLAAFKHVTNIWSVWLF